MQNKPLSIAFSPCPNDTYIFYALVSGLLDYPGFSLKKEVLEDVEALNEDAFNEKFDITKISFHAYGHLQDKYTLLNSGSALGRGCGPLLVVNKGDELKSSESCKIAIPGRYTTAAMLLKLFYPNVQTIAMRFDKIMESVVSQEVDAGVIIHESRFTYEDYGLEKVVDLGQRWEDETGFPIPLGGIAVRKSLGDAIVNKVDEAVRKSLQWANTNVRGSLPYIKKHAQELDDSVIQNHISLYVNKYSIDLGSEGKKAIEKFLEMGKNNGLFG